MNAHPGIVADRATTELLRQYELNETMRVVVVKLFEPGRLPRIAYEVHCSDCGSVDQCDSEVDASCRAWFGHGCQASWSGQRAS
jgi:hypothetical protein